MLATVKGDVHDIGKNLVDIILTNNGYEVFNLGIKVPIADMVAKVKEVDADAIGMSGLLVKSTLIMRDNLEELNDLGLAEMPVLLGGRGADAHLRGEGPARGLRGPGVLRPRRVRGPPHHGQAHDDEAQRHRRPRLRPRADGPGAAEAGVGARRRGRPATIPSRSPSVVTDNPVFVPPFVGSRLVKGISLDEIAVYVNETALFRNQWQYRPEAGEDDDAFKDRIRPQLRAMLSEAKASRRARAAGRLRLLAGQQRRRRPGRVDRRVAHRRGDAVRLPPPAHRAVAVHRRLLPLRRQRRDRLRRLPHRHDGQRRCPRRRPSCSPRTATRSTSCCTASASRWPRRWPSCGTGASASEWGFAAEDGPPIGGLFRQQYRGGRYSWGYPACPDLEDNATVAQLLGAERLGIEVSEETGWQYQPEQTTSAIICHHPQAKYFVAR